MSWFSAITNTYKKSQAAVVVQNLLEHQARNGYFDLDPGLTANRLVASICDEKPDLFNGKFGQKPHKITTAAIAFSDAILRFGNDEKYRSTFTICLGNVLYELEVNRRLYQLNSMDDQLIETASNIYLEEVSRNLGTDGSSDSAVA